MKQWDKINWPAMNRRARKIEADLQQGWPERGDFKEKGITAPGAQTDRNIAQGLMMAARRLNSDICPIVEINTRSHLSRPNKNGGIAQW